MSIAMQVVFTSIDVVVKKKDQTLLTIAKLHVAEATKKFGDDVEVKVGHPEITEAERNLIRLVKNMQERGIVVNSLNLIKEAGGVEKLEAFNGLTSKGILRDEGGGVFSLTEKWVEEEKKSTNDSWTIIRVEVKKDDPKLYREIAERVIASLHEVDVTIKEKPVFHLSSEEKTVLIAVKSLQERNREPNIYEVLTLAGINGLATGLAVQSLLKQRLIKKDEREVFKLTEWGEEQLAKIREEKRLH